MPDDGRLDRILSGLPPDDAAYLSSLVEPPWRQRARRLTQRDDAIRRALAHLVTESEPNPPRRLAAQLADQVTRPGRMLGDHILAAFVATILELNDGEPIKEGQLRNIAKGERSPVQ